MADSNTKKLTIFIAEALWRAAKKKMVDADLSFQRLFQRLLSEWVYGSSGTTADPRKGEAPMGLDESLVPVTKSERAPVKDLLTVLRSRQPVPTDALLANLDAFRQLVELEQTAELQQATPDARRGAPGGNQIEGDQREPGEGSRVRSRTGDRPGGEGRRKAG